ncbi:MAG: ATP-binding protein [Hyphomicrobiales bacterium]
MQQNVSQKLTQRAEQRIRDSFLAIALLMIVVLALRAGHEYKLKQTEDLLIDVLSTVYKIEALEIKIFHAVEMATTSNAPKWNAIRNENVPLLKQELQKLRAMAPNQTEFKDRLSRAGRILAVAHNAIFADSNAGDFTAARNRARDINYQWAKQYANEAINGLRKSTQASLIDKRETNTFLANTLTLGAILFGMCIIRLSQMLNLKEDRNHFASISDDILELRDENTNLADITQEQLKKIDELAAVSEITSNMVMLKGPDRKVRWVNNAFCELTGYTLEEVQEKPFYFDAVVTTQLNEVLQKPAPAEALVESKIKTYEYNVGRFDSCFITKKGSTIWLSMDSQKLVDINGVLTGYVLVGTDVTLKKQQEIQITSYASDMKRFAHVASHDLKEPMRQIGDYLNVLKEADSVGDTELKTRCYDVMSKATKRGRNLVSDLLRFAKLQDLTLGKAFHPIEEVLEPILEQLEVSNFPGNVTFTSDVPRVLVNADDRLLQSVIQNLISNAVKYTAPDRPNAVHLGMENDGDVYRLFVTDTGIGFKDEQSQSIFEPFTRLVTKQRFAGSGVGLSIVSSVVQKHGWQITAKGEEGVGASFEIVFPATDVMKIDPATSQTEEAA